MIRAKFANKGAIVKNGRTGSGSRGLLVPGKTAISAGREIRPRRYPKVIRKIDAGIEYRFVMRSPTSPTRTVKVTRKTRKSTLSGKSFRPKPLAIFVIRFQKIRSMTREFQKEAI